MLMAGSYCLKENVNYSRYFSKDFLFIEKMKFAMSFQAILRVMRDVILLAFLIWTKKFDGLVCERLSRLCNFLNLNIILISNKNETLLS